MFGYSSQYKPTFEYSGIILTLILTTHLEQTTFLINMPTARGSEKEKLQQVPRD